VQFRLEFQPEVEETLVCLQCQDPDKYHKVRKILGLMQDNLRHPSLHTHKYKSLRSADNREIFTAYVENHTPGAWRVFWYYGPGQGTITILAVIAHP
jgi:hypothetical protein